MRNKTETHPVDKAVKKLDEARARTLAKRRKRQDELFATQIPDLPW